MLIDVKMPTTFMSRINFVFSLVEYEKVLELFANGNMIRYDPTLVDLTSNFLGSMNQHESLFM